MAGVIWLFDVINMIYIIQVHKKHVLHHKTDTVGLQIDMNGPPDIIQSKYHVIFTLNGELIHAEMNDSICTHFEDCQ